MATAVENTRPYPGFDSSGTYFTPRPMPRVKPEAEEIAKKLRGSLDLFSQEPKPHIETPRPSPRCPGADARKNYEIGRHGLVSGLLNGQATPRADAADAVPRVKPEAEAVADVHKGKATASLLQSYGNLPSSARPVPRVKVEAEKSAVTHQGGRMSCLLHSPNQLPASARSVPRVKPEAAQTAGQEGREMSKTLQKYGGGLTHRPAPRVKPEAESIAEQDKGKRMGSLLDSYGNLPQSARPAPRVKEEAKDMATMDQGGRLSRLMHEGNKLPRSPKPAPRNTTKEARHISKAHRGQIGRLFSEQGRKDIVAVPGHSRSLSKTM